MTHATPSNPLTRLAAAAKADPTKAGLLAILLVVMTVLWARAAGAPGPRAADASAQLPAPGPTAPAAPANTPGSLAALTEWGRGPIRPADRNLFAVKLDYFRQDPALAKPVLRLPSGDGFWDLLAKSMISRADQKEEKRILVENIQLRAAQLRLQTTLMGARPRAMINNELVAEGDAVAGFRVLRIEARRIVVEREGVKLEITMK